MKIALIVLGVLGILVIGIVMIGYALPVKHRASRSEVFNVSPEELWAALIDFKKYPEWRADVRKSEARGERNGREVWRETDSHRNVIEYATLEAREGRRLVRRIATPDLPYGGTWTFEIAPAGPNRTALSITEDGEVYNPIFRIVSRFIMGYTFTMDRFLADLQKKFAD